MADPNKYVVVIGIDDYADTAIQNLTFASADAEAKYAVLTDPECGNIPTDNVRKLVNGGATQKAIKSTIATWLASIAREEDTVVVFFAGQGAPGINPGKVPGRGQEVYLVPHDAEAEDLRSTGIAMDEIQRWFGFIDSRRVLFLIDSCYSGMAGGRTFSQPGVAAQALTSSEFLDHLAGEGRTVITACDVNELSLEATDLGHGVFSHFLLNGLQGAADSDRYRRIRSLSL